MGFALKLLSYRERSVGELRERLLAKGFGGEEAESAVEYLKGAGYLDDERFAVNLAASRVRTKNWGPRKVTEELLSRGVSKEAVKKALSAVEDEEDVARRALEKWLRMRGKEKNAVQKAYRHLLARGFSGSVIARLIRGLKENS